MNAFVRAARAAAPTCSRRALHASATARAVTSMQMPAMSPTMKEGGIASWKLKEGDSFAAGDVLVEIETDKATIDVEAQDDGVLGKIILGDGAKNVPVGKVIAMLAEEGDDISNIEAPKDESAPAPKQESAPSPPSGSASSSAPPKADASKPSGEHAHGTPTHSRPLFPSVLRLLQEAGVSDAAQIKGTGMRGMLTKGDVLAFLGRASGPLGTYKPPKPDTAAPKASGAGSPPSKPTKPLTGHDIRTAILAGMLEASKPKAAALPATLDFDDIIGDYLPARGMSASPLKDTAAVPPVPSGKASGDWLDGLL